MDDVSRSSALPEQGDHGQHPAAPGNGSPRSNKRLRRQHSDQPVIQHVVDAAQQSSARLFDPAAASMRSEFEQILLAEVRDGKDLAVATFDLTRKHLHSTAAILDNIKEAIQNVNNQHAASSQLSSPLHVADVEMGASVFTGNDSQPASKNSRRSMSISPPRGSATPPAAGSSVLPPPSDIQSLAGSQHAYNSQSTSSSQPLELCQDGALVDPPSYYTNSRNRAAKLKAFADAKNLAQQLYARAKADNIWFHFVKNEAREGGLCHSDQLKVPDSEEDKSVLAAIEQVATEQADRETGKDFSYDKDFYGSLGLFANAGKHIDDCRTEWPTDEAGRFVERRVRVYQKQREVLKNYAKRYHGGDWTPTHFELDNCGNHVAHWLVHRYTTFPTVCDKLKTHGNSLVQAEKDKEKQGQVDALLQVDKNGNSKLHRAIFQGDVTRAKRAVHRRRNRALLEEFAR